MLQEHEHVHCKQYEGASLTGFVLALCGLAFGAPLHVSLATWIVTPWLYMLGGNVVAWLRGDDAYSGSANEEAAYALAAGNSKP